MDFGANVKKASHEKLPECYSFLLEDSGKLLRTALETPKEAHLKNLQSCKKQANTYQYATGGDVLHRGYYCPSLVRDIVIGNCSRGRIVAGNGKNAKQTISYEYGFHNEQLVFVQHHISGIAPEFEYISYFDNRQIGYTFDREMALTAISECVYLHNKLISYSLVYLNSCGAICSCEKEIYEYRDGLLDSATLYVMQTVNSCAHLKYVFCHDSDGFLSSYKSIEFNNGLAKEDYDWKDHQFKVYKKRKV